MLINYTLRNSNCTMFSWDALKPVLGCGLDKPDLKTLLLNRDFLHCPFLCKKYFKRYVIQYNF